MTADEKKALARQRKENRKTAKEIMDFINYIIVKKILAVEDVKGPVNWRDFRCVDIQEHRSLMGYKPFGFKPHLYAMLTTKAPLEIRDKLFDMVQSALDHVGYPVLVMEEMELDDEAD